jgi:signal transduction histidine kinase
MADDDKAKLRFRPRARIIRTIGDQLISGPEAAVIELVKNAYDADASYVWIKFTPPLVAGAGRITIVDDGHGMSLDDIREKWMEPATSAKSANRASPRLKRVMMGSKGIGRFAAAKLGRKLGVASISYRNGERQEVLIPEIDWSIFDGDTYLSDIEIDYLSQTTEEATGTDIEVRELNEAWPLAKLTRLHLELRRLISPVEWAHDDVSFRVYLDLSECTVKSSGIDGAAVLGANPDVDQEAGTPPAAYEVRPFPLLTNCDYEVLGSFDEAGKFDGTMQIKRAGQGPIPIDLVVPLRDDETECGAVGVHLYIFDRETEAIRRTMTVAGMENLTATSARKMLDETAGVAIYRDGFRVRPYGDAENDWLTLDRRRVQNPSLRIGHNQIAGYVTVRGQADSGLIERSSREGFEQNDAFSRLVELIRELLTQVVEPRRYDFRDKAGISRSRTTTFDEVRQLSGLQKIRELISRLPIGEREAATAVINRESAQLVDKIAVLEERQRVLEAKSSLGAIIGEVLHEGSPAVTYIASTSRRLLRLYPDLLTTTDRTQTARDFFSDRLHYMRVNSDRLSELFKALRPLAGGKRGNPVYFEPAAPIAAAKAIFDTHETKIVIYGGWQGQEIVGYPDDLLTAAVNLFGNSIHWLEEARIPDPQIDVHIFTQAGDLVIYIDDNGPGIPREFSEFIFDVGFSLKKDGTGLGLNIAREALARSDGRLGYHMDYEGGTRFEIRFQLPTRKG